MVLVAGSFMCALRHSRCCCCCSVLGLLCCIAQRMLMQGPLVGTAHQLGFTWGKLGRCALWAVCVHGCLGAFLQLL
eukprot:1142174-Pelagomonas_calceolata.AAC.4